MARRDPPELVCVACGHVIGLRDGFVYRVIDGREGVWCPGCAPGAGSSGREDAGDLDDDAATVGRARFCGE
jgi:hypothetical protein